MNYQQPAEDLDLPEVSVSTAVLVPFMPRGAHR